MSRRALWWIDLGLVISVVAVLAVLFLAYNNPFRPVLRVWSCGGNYHSLSAFSREFEAKYRCRVRYTAAPVQFLLDRAAFTDVHPDVLVGRGGPGWLALDQLAKLASPPTFFAVDPFCILVRRDNPKGVSGLFDLCSPSVRVAVSTSAMRPKGMCPAALMTAAARFHPGIDEAWQSNCAKLRGVKCGRHLVSAVADGRVDAALGFTSLATYPEARGRVEAIPVDVKYVKAMQSCKAAVAQCMAVLKGSRQPVLAQAFRDELLGPLGRRVMEANGYIHITSPAIGPYADFVRAPFRPKRMSAWQVHMADNLRQDGIEREAIRKYLAVIHVFGPGEHDAYCRYHAADTLDALGAVPQAVAQWQRLVREFPRGAVQEYGGRTEDLVGSGPQLDLPPEAYWVAEARVRLAEARALGIPAAGSGVPWWLPRLGLAPPQVAAGDPGKNGKRHYALAVDLFLSGDHEFATRDFLKVSTLAYPSSYIPAAQYMVALCDWMRGLKALACEHWRTLLDEYPQSGWAALAREAIEAAGNIDRWSAPRERMPAWSSEDDTWPTRGMSYGMALYRHNLPLFAFKEMVKLVHDSACPPALKAEARYRAGVALLDYGSPEAAAQQWRLCRRDHAGSRWAEAADGALRKLKARGLVSEEALSRPLPRLHGPDKPACWYRLKIAEELASAGIDDQGEAALEYTKALTVTRASPGRYDERVVPRAELGLASCLEKRDRAHAALRHRWRAQEAVGRPTSGAEAPRPPADCGDVAGACQRRGR